MSNTKMTDKQKVTTMANSDYVFGNFGGKVGQMSIPDFRSHLYDDSPDGESPELSALKSRISSVEDKNTEQDERINAAQETANSARKTATAASTAAQEAKTAAETTKSELNGKQDALTITVKDNGNIVLANIQGQSKEFMPATPSGDPLHWVYIKRGAEYNDTGADIVKDTPWADLADDDADKTVVHKAGYWYLNGIGDLTTNEIHDIFVTYAPLEALISNISNVMSHCPIRTNFVLRIRSQDYFEQCFFSNSHLKVINLDFTSMQIRASTFMFYNNINVSHILGRLSINPGYNSPNFENCNSLKTIRFNVSKNINFMYSSLLTIKSVLYMINNEKATSPITITLHADVYNKCMANEDISDALAAHTNISIANA